MFTEVLILEAPYVEGLHTQKGHWKTLVYRLFRSNL